MPSGGAPYATVHVGWDDWSRWHLLRPLAVQAALSVLFLVALHPFYAYAFRRRSFKTFVQAYVGTRDRAEIPHATCLVAVHTLQVLSSLVTVGVWICNVYAQATTGLSRMLMFGTVCIDLLNWVINCLKGGFRITALWEVNALVDVVTIVPTLCVHLFPDAPEARTGWLSLHFLRAYSMLFNFLMIRATGSLKHTGVIGQMVVLAMLRVYVLIVPMAGFVMTSEILGDPVWLADHYIESPGGDKLSVIQMVNWVIVSICTVGDGGFNPKTVVMRSFWSIFLVVGVGYVFYIQFAFGQAWVNNREGSGAYNPRMKGTKHVVVILQVRGYGKDLSSIILGFLGEILHTTRKKDWPDIVLFSPTHWDPSVATGGKATFAQFLKDKRFSNSVQRRVFFVRGDVTRREDLERAKVGSSALTYVLPDIGTEKPHEDDELTIVTALNLKRFYSDVRLRLMLLLPQSKDLAVQSGIMMERCFSIRELKAHLLAQNVRCHGLLPMITGIFKSVDQDELAAVGKDADVPSKGNRGIARRQTPSVNFPKWVLEYVVGVERSVYGFELAPDLAGCSFGELVAQVHEGCGAVVFAVFMNGRVSIVPQDLRKMTACQVCFAIAAQAEDLAPWSDPDRGPLHWRDSVLEARDIVARRAKSDGPHVAAAMLVGQQLKDCILKMEDQLGFMDSHGDFARQGTPESQGSGGEASQAGGRAAVRRGTRGSTRKMSVMSGMSFQTSAYGGAGAGAGAAMTAAEAAELEEMGVVQRVRLLRQSVHETEELVVVVVCQGEVWQQVRSFVGALRSPYQPVFRPIVVLAPTEPPPRLLEGIKDRVLTMVGSCTKVQQLVEAGILEAGSIVLMSGEIPKAGAKKSSLAIDSRVVLGARMIECWCGVSRREIFTTYELQDSASVSDLPALVAKPAIQLHQFIAEKAFDEGLDEEDEEMQEDGSGAKNEEEDFQTEVSTEQACLSTFTSGNLLSKSKQVNSITFNIRFAAGQVLTPEVWGCMLGCMYHNPAVIELTEALVMPQRRGQKAFPWQMRPPAGYILQPFSCIFRDLVLGGWMEPRAPLRLQEGEPRPGTGKEGPAIAVALYRKRTERFHDVYAAEGTGSSHYLVLAPPPETPLKAEDWIVVLGSRRFGRRLHAMGLLRGSKRKETSYEEDAMQAQSSLKSEAGGTPGTGRRVSLDMGRRESLDMGRRETRPQEPGVLVPGADVAAGADAASATIPGRSAPSSSLMDLAKAEKAETPLKHLAKLLGKRRDQTGPLSRMGAMGLQPGGGEDQVPATRSLAGGNAGAGPSASRMPKIVEEVEDVNVDKSLDVYSF